MSSEQIQHSVRTLLDTQKLAVLATQNSERPYTSLVAFAVSRDLKNVYFATARATRKYDNLISRPQVALLVDNRKNTHNDFQDAVAVTIIGRTRELSDNTDAPEIEVLLKRHPELQTFVNDQDSATFAVDVSSYVHVCRFGEVTEYTP